MVPPRNPGEQGAPDETMESPRNPAGKGAPDEAREPPRNLGRGSEALPRDRTPRGGAATPKGRETVRQGAMPTYGNGGARGQGPSIDSR